MRNPSLRVLALRTTPGALTVTGSGSTINVKGFFYYNSDKGHHEYYKERHKHHEGKSGDCPSGIRGNECEDYKDGYNAGKQDAKMSMSRAYAKRLHRLTHGFEMDLPIQSVPDLIRILSGESIAIYQVVRYAKVDGAWQ